jgi:hypothetical protein
MPGQRIASLTECVTALTSLRLSASKRIEVVEILKFEYTLHIGGDYSTIVVRCLRRYMLERELSHGPA